MQSANDYVIDVDLMRSNAKQFSVRALLCAQSKFSENKNVRLLITKTH